MKTASFFNGIVIAIICFLVSPLSADLVHRYSFNADASDSVGSADGTLEGGATVSGGQLLLAGGPDNTAPHVDLPSDILSNYTSATIEAWFTIDAQVDWQRLFDFGDTSGSDGGYYWFYTPSSSNGDSRLVISTGGFPGYSGEERVDSSTVPTGTPIFVACVYDAAAGQMRLYEDGQLVDSDSVSMLLSDVSRTFAYIGASVYPPDDGFDGAVDEFRIYDSALTGTQIQEHDTWGPDWIDEPVVEITESGGMTILYTGNVAQMDDYEVVLLAEPTDEVQITVTPSAGLSVGNGDGQPRQLTFDDTDWDDPQTVTVSIADPLAAFDDPKIQHTIQSDDPQYDDIPIRDVTVIVQEDECGIWGYLPSDYNLDCKINLEDFSMLASLWLMTDSPLDLEPFGQDWLLNTFFYEEDTYNRSIRESSEPFFVNTTNIVNTIDEKVYGHFLEHIYHSANGGLWGDLVWNRSFEISGSGGAVWTIENGDELVQSSLATDVHMEFGDTGWDDYELTLQAQKDGGSEGFLIVFRAPDSDNFYWLNLGGWGNTLHAIQKEVNGGRSTVTSSISGSINTGQWYDIRIRCEDNNIQVWLDDSPLFDYTDTGSSYLTGNIGVGTWATQARFRNIEVTNLAGTTTLYSGLPTLTGNDFGADFWTVFGTGDATISTDALNDDYSVQIIGDGSATGLQQDNFKFTQQAYHGSLWMKGGLPAGVKVELLDGETVLGQSTLSSPTSSWAEYAFSITPSASTDDGSLRITLLGAGTVYIDQVSMMGQDAIDTGGYRPDLLDAVADLRPPIIRWPGGCFASLYLWKDAIGPQEDRKRYTAYMWEDQDTNSYGTDEFLQMCENIGAEPLIVINTGITDSACGGAAQWFLEPRIRANYIQYAEDWMEYCNGDAATTTWGAVRAANGHPEPYNVTYWEIDNETWHAGWETYVDVVQDFAPALRAKAAELGVPIKISAVGGGSYDMNWNGHIIDECAEVIDYISVHHYEGSGGYKSGPITYDNFLTTLANYIAGSDNPDLKIYNSEWNLQTTDWRTGLYAGGILNVYEKHGADFEIGGPALFLRHTSAGSWDNAFINFDHTGWFPAPNYVVMKLWHDHYAPNRVQTTGTDTNLNVVSTLSDDAKTLYIQIVNPDGTDKSLAFEIDGSFVPETAYMHYVDTGGDLYARNTLADPDAVHVQAKVIGLDNQVLRFMMPAYSVGVVTVETTQPHNTKFLYSSFQGGGDGLHLAYSDDGLTFTPLDNDNVFLYPTIGGGLMRDPSICRGPDGTFHMVWTTDWDDDGIGVAHSPDLINWSAQTYLPVMQEYRQQSYVYNCWAPEIFYDRDTGKYLIFWSSTIEPNGSTNNHRIWYITTEDFVTYTDAALFYDPGWSCIDAFIAKDGDRYAMVLKDERDTGKNIRITFSDNAAGPYDVPPSGSITPSGLWVEGPSMVKVGQEWILYYDAYTSGYMGGQSSPDLDAWTDIRGEISFPSGTRHGTVFRVSQDILDALLAL